MIPDPDDPRDLRGLCILRSGFYNIPPEPWYQPGTQATCYLDFYKSQFHQSIEPQGDQDVIVAKIEIVFEIK